MTDASDRDHRNAASEIIAEDLCLFRQFWFRMSLFGENIVQAIPLNRVNLARLPPSVLVPRFNVTHVTAGIVHLGMGGFHRAHMARYTHNLMERRPDALGWGIIGAGLMPADRRMQTA